MNPMDAHLPYLDADSHNTWMPTFHSMQRQLQYIHTLVADEEGIYGFLSLHRVGLTQHGKIYRVDYGLELTIM